MPNIPLIGNNIYLVAAMTGMEVEELLDKMSEAERKYIEEQKLEWQAQILRKDAEWVKKTKAKVDEMSENLPDNLSSKEKIKRLYGWIADELNFPCGIPFFVNNDREYQKAYCIYLILSDPELYTKMINWD